VSPESKDKSLYKERRHRLERKTHREAQTNVTTTIFETTKEKHRFSCRYSIKIRVDGSMLVC